MSAKHIHVHLHRAPARDAGRTVTYAQLMKKLRDGDWEAMSDLRRSSPGASYGTQEIKDLTKAGGLRFTAQVEKIPADAT